MHIINARKLTKIYKLGQTHTNLLSEKIGNKIYQLYRKLRNSDTTENKTDKYQKSDELENTIYALKDVSFDVEQGEVMGIIGRNGAGKSTLLKILSRITAPSSGQVELFGRVASLLEVGTGFHAELTGRENIFLNGSILGMKRREIKKKFDEIIDFAEISAFVDTPVKRYSSGMYVRLAFAVAAHLDPDILIVDEVLAVGDASFRRKCMGKMGEVSKKGRTILFVSHNMIAIQSLCDRALLLSKGKLAFNGDVDLCIRKYKANNKTERHKKLSEREDRSGNRKLLVKDFWIEDEYGIRSDSVATGDNITLVIKYKANDKIVNVNIGVNFYDVDGYSLTNLTNEDIGYEIKVPPRSGLFICNIPSFPLTEGLYKGNIWIEVDRSLADWIRPAFEIKVEDGDFYGTGKIIKKGKFVTNYSWSLKE